ncbi:MAG: hypothetical protein DWQ21_06760 [Bacteroidetes bacterium]|nr:MAG: hypothetical protein DWQ21_06760 [Bacteroidota bacterium]REK56219.1 MAG: hypothetical protein DWQ49_10125 [Bacteroidota bacterium]
MLADLVRGNVTLIIQLIEHSISKRFNRYEIKNQPVVGWFPEYCREEGISCLQQENPKEELSIQ